MVMNVMALAQSKVTAQGQVSVPSEVRRRLGVGPGSVLEWAEEDGKLVVRRAGRYSSQEVSHALFPSGPPKAKTLAALKDGIRKSMRERYARR